MSTTSKDSEDPFNAEHGIEVPSYSSPAPDLFFPASIDEVEKQEDVKSTAAEAITPWKYWGFETGDIGTGWEWGKSQYQAGTTDRLVRVSSTLAEGDYSLRVTVKANDLHSGGERAEVVQTSTANPHFKEGDIVHYYWWTLFPSSFVTSSLWHVWTQWHQTSDTACCVPDLEFVLHGNTIGLWVYKNRDASDILWSAPLQLGHWYRFQLIVKWSTTNQGFVQLWVDGKNVVNTFHITLDPTSTPYSTYMKQGLYRHKDINHDQTIYHDGMAFHYH
jgi:Polysaccharide lyase